MHWIHLTDEDQIQNILIRSQDKPQVIFKYSYRCSLSEMIFQRLQKNCCPEHLDFYFLDVLSHRDISNLIEEKFDVGHESPQVLVIRDGVCIFDQSHTRISMEDILGHVAVAV
jgi:bacillithiol system protein YtxJ